MEPEIAVALDKALLGRWRHGWLNVAILLFAPSVTYGVHGNLQHAALALAVSAALVGWRVSP